MGVSKHLVHSALPFYWRLAASDAESPVDITNLPFCFDSQGPSWLVQQKITPDLRSALDRVYLAEENIGYLQPGYEIAQGYLVDFMNLIVSILSESAIKGPILEVGCGGCEVLDRLKNLGHAVIGVDPSPVAKFWGQKKGISVLAESFNPLRHQKQFQMALCSDVLEHVENPVHFIQGMKSVVVSGGFVVVAVPDCTLGIRLGDVSFAMHQHLTYFSEHSLRVCLIAAGLTDVRVVSSGYGGSLYGIGQVSGQPSSQDLDTQLKGISDIVSLASSEVKRYLAIFEQKLEIVREHLNVSLSSGADCAFYVPLRALPYLSQKIIEDYYDRVRFIDDTAHWHGKCFDGLPIRIENFSDLSRNIPTHVYIMSLTFERQISHRLASLGGQSPRITKLSDLLV